MSDTPLKLTRNQIAEFMPNIRGIRVFEQLIRQVGDIQPGDLTVIRQLIDEVTIDAATGGARATQAIAAINRLADALDSLSLAPPRQIDTFTKTDYVDFDTLPPEPAYAVGRMWWNANGTLNLGMGGGNITQQVGEEAFVYGKASAAITNGQLIVLTGAVGASGVPTFAPSTAGLLDPNLIVGVATENIANNAFGRVTTFGVIHGIDTSGTPVGETWLDGDLLWYRTGGSGTMTKVRPSAPNMKTAVALVINAGPGGSGSVQVQLVRGSALGVTDSNVEITSPADKQILQYDGAVGYWRNVAQSGGGITASETHATTSKTTPVDADEIPLADSAASFALKKLTWANLKATLATWINGNLIAASFTQVTSSTTMKTATTAGVGNATPSASGAGVSFPAAQSPSTDPNTLDDYEEGAWTPVVSFVTPGNLAVAYNTQLGTYTKIGRLVVVQFTIQTSSFTYTTATGNLVINGFPFALSGISRASCSLEFQGITKAGWTAFSAAIASGTTVATVLASGSAQALNSVDTSNVVTGSSVFLSGTLSYIS